MFEDLYGNLWDLIEYRRSASPLARSPAMQPEAAQSALATPQVARAAFRGKRIAAAAEVRATPLGLLAVGGLVSAILLSVAPIILSARVGRSKRRPPA
ncbi:hypothetical protein BH09PSE4_BH09PSE4_00960 [soil metagenome]